MIANLLPSEATHTTLEFFEKPPLRIIFDDVFTQKIGPFFLTRQSSFRVRGFG